MRSLDVEVEAAAFVVALLKAGMLDQAESFVEWYIDEVGDAPRLERLIEEED